ncbi:hypothetical protein F5J12DRAFT_786519 [Pisolithus orientalis]|uniref:uncharacterized protein n=1 Tax=Pisolithus orientalis TaxID=936130 RepID=UPI002224FB2C|nr:uncharacterized protein F5J12DRAFT_786519 [Pisolithus orientalis]KAI5990293.1 hypothetical protein F5J12DRAFT_786519 [Pisolithus orientalis]
MKVPCAANELLWWMAVQNMGETALMAHIMELNVLQVKRGEEGKESLPLLYDMDWMPSDSISWLIESRDEMIHQEEIHQLHGVMEFCSEWLTLFDRLGQVQDQLEDFQVNSVTQPGASNK